MTTFHKTLIATLTLGFAALAAQAQTPATPRVDERQAEQHQRIQQGVASGQLTARETHRLRAEQRAIRHAEAQAKADGVVTAAERRHIQHLQNKASRDIRRQKHDAQVRG